VIASSEAAAAGIDQNRLAIAYPPVRLADDFRVSWPRPPATLTCVGRLEPTKGQRLLIEAAATLSERFGDLRVVLAGSEPRYALGYESELRQCARASGLDGKVEFAGWVDSVERVLDQSTVYVQPSFGDRRTGSESFGMAVAEASWAGLPVVASRTGGTPEVVRDGVTGTLVPEGDSAALAGAVARYLADPATAQAAGRAGQRFARDRFSPRLVVAQWFDALERFLS
jgi:glycosyltransferase involved in cell wall biosynthesis